MHVITCTMQKVLYNSNTIVYIAGTIDCTKIVEKIKHIYDKLMRLPIKSMLPQLFGSRVITEGQKKRIEAKELESDGMQYFLDEVLILSLELDMTEIYNKFIKILEDSEDLIQNAMAKKIGEGGYL